MSESIARISRKKAFSKATASAFIKAFKKHSGTTLAYYAQTPLLKPVIDNLTDVLCDFYSKYKKDIDDQKLKITLDNINSRLTELETNWHSAKNNLGDIQEELFGDLEQEMLQKKIVKYIFDDEQSDKQQLFICAFISSHFSDFETHEKNKYVHLLKSLSLQAIIVLSELIKLHKNDKPSPATGVWLTMGNVVENLKRRSTLKTWDANIIELCVTELRSAGLLSVSAGWNSHGERLNFSKVTEEFYLTRTCFKFVDFLTNGTYIV